MNRRRHLGLVALAALLTACATSASGDAADSTAPDSTGSVAGATTANSTGPTTTTSTTETSTTETSTTETRITSTSTTSTSTTSTSTTSTSTTSTSTTSTTTTTEVPTTTSCTDVAHVSDSTGVYLWEPQYVDGAANTMGERYRSVGVERWIDDSSGGRSVRERVAEWQTNALDVVDAIRRSGFVGCWVLMIGTNDAANIAAGSNLGAEERILRMLYVIGDDPVLWVDAATNRGETAYRNDNMRAWNETLSRIAAERENVQVLRWSERVQPGWFVSDGIHMGTEGRIWRAAATAAALVEFFPA